jgi:hypothetical protein
MAVKPGEQGNSSDAAVAVGDPVVVHSTSSDVDEVHEPLDVAPAHVDADDREEAGYGYGV